MNIRRDHFLRLHRAPFLCAALLAAAPLPGQSPGADAPPTSPAPAAEAQAAFRKLLDSKQYEQAVAEAQTLVEEASRHPEAGEDLQVALMNLAVAQYLAGDYVGAEASYVRVIELVEASGRLTSPRLARAEAGLAATYHAGKRHDLAVQHFDRAVALSRRSEGLFNEAQLPLLGKYADSLTELGRLEAALKVQRYSLRVVERKHGAASLPYAKQLESVGRWYARTGEYDASRSSLRRAIAIVETAQGPNAVELIGPLTALAECDRRQLLDPRSEDLATTDDQRRSMFHDPTAPIGPTLSAGMISAEGQKALERAVAIATGRPDTPAVQVADVRTQLGDWYQSRLQADKALPAYRLAWQSAVGQTFEGRPLNERLFGRPTLLHYVPPFSWDRYAGRPPGETTVRIATIEFTVTAQGQAVDPKVTNDGGDPDRGEQTVRAARTARYRPRLQDGQPVDTAGVTLDQPFYVLVEDLPQAEAPKPDG